MAGAIQKPREQLVNRRGGRGDHTTEVTVPVTWAERDEIPALPRNTYGEVAAQVWEAFWRSDIAVRVDLRSEGYYLVRWLDAVDDRERFLEEANREPLVCGSQGQQVLNPLYRRVAELERIIQWSADHFGLTMLSKFRARIAFSEAAQSEDRLERVLSRRREEAEGARAAAATMVESRVIAGSAREVEL